jgi:type IV pilus assembly protein PilA
MTPTQLPSPATKPAALPLVALILGVVGFCIPPLFLVAIVLAIISLVRAGDPAYGQRKVLAIITLVLGLVYVPVVGILAAIAVPNFIKYQARAKQTEGKMLMRQLFAAEASYFATSDEYTASREKLGLEGTSSRYLCRLAADGPLEEVAIVPNRLEGMSVQELDARIPRELLAEVGVGGDCPKCEATMVCVGNIDGDSTVDLWSISTKDRMIRGELVPAGSPFHHLDDLTE